MSDFPAFAFSPPKSIVRRNNERVESNQDISAAQDHTREPEVSFSREGQYDHAADRREQARNVDHVWKRYDGLPVSISDTDFSIHSPPEGEEL